MSIESAGASTGVVVVLEQCGWPGQLGSPPPLTVAVFERFWPIAAAVGVTGITNDALAPLARPAGIVHVTVWPVRVQPAGKVPITRSPGITSVTVAAAVVAAVPLLVTVSV